MKRSAVLAVATGAIVVALAAYAWRGSYARYYGDDYCTAVSTRKHGPVGVVLEFRERWSGRFSFFFAKSLLERAGPWTPRVLPAVLIAAFVAAGVFALRRALDAPAPVALLASAAGVFATLDASPNVLAIEGPLVWETGAMTYVLPLLLFVLWGVLFAPGSAWRSRCVLSALLMFFAGGLSETSVAAQGALAGGALVVSLIWRDRPRAAVAACGLAATIAAVAVMWTAHGTAVRMTTTPETPSLVSAALQSLLVAGMFLGSQTLPYGWALLLVLVAGSILGASSPRVRARSAVAAGVISSSAYLASFFPSAWTQANTPPDRALLVSNFFLVIAAGAFAAAFNSRTQAHTDRDLRADYAALLLLCVIPLFSAVRTMRDIPRGRQAAAEIERIGAILRSERGRDAVIRSPWAIDSRFGAPWPQELNNRCLSEYYSARSVRFVR